MTIAHRDSMDKNICLVFPIGDFQGGDLCLYEPGIRVPLSPGDVLVFPSGNITHFNLGYLGVRHSMVLHTDSAFDGWVDHNNFWTQHVDENDPSYSGLASTSGSTS